MRIAICDDNPDVAPQLKISVSGLPFVDDVTAFNSIDAFVSAIKEGALFDVALMDICWNTARNGIDYASELYTISPSTKIIFITGYAEQYVEQIWLKNFNRCGFVKKPVDMKILSAQLMQIHNQNAVPKFIVRHGGDVIALDPDDIYYMESVARKFNIHTKDSIYDCYGKLCEVRLRLPAYFVFCHKSYMANMKYIKRIENEKLFLLDGAVLPISRTYRASLKKSYFQYVELSL